MIPYWSASHTLSSKCLTTRTLTVYLMRGLEVGSYRIDSASLQYPSGLRLSIFLMCHHKMADFLILGYFLMVTRQPSLFQVSYLQVTRNIIHSVRLGTKSSKEDMGGNGSGESGG